MVSVSVAKNEEENPEEQANPEGEQEVTEEKDVLKSFLWDEENRLLAVNNNGSVSCYFYDAAGERTVKLTSETEMVHVNGKKVGGNDAVTKFTAYVSPYFVVSNGGAYTKHIYAASQRIASKLGNEDGFGADPRRVEMAGGKKISDIQKDNIGARFKELGFTYSAPEKEKVEKDSSMDSEAEEKLIFFYHPDHLGSTSYVTDADGNIAQHIEYIPYGEVFVEERNNSFSTNYLFNAKELDNETGLYYYGARYLDPTGAMWLSVDPVFHAGISPYAYCLGNPVKMVDPDGRVECDENGNVNVVYDVNRVNALIQQRLNDPNLSIQSTSDLTTSPYLQISSVDENGNVNMEAIPTIWNNKTEVTYQCGIARTDGGREFLVLSAIDGPINEQNSTNCFGLALLGGQMGILCGDEADILLRDEFDEIKSPAYSMISGGVAIWGTEGSNRNGNIVPISQHAAGYIGNKKTHGFIYKNNFDGEVGIQKTERQSYLFQNSLNKASCGFPKDNTKYYNPISTRRFPKNIFQNKINK